MKSSDEYKDEEKPALSNKAWKKCWVIIYITHTKIIDNSRIEEEEKNEPL